jgi:16S rRNA C1402 N4-methylase RsmH
MAEARRQNLVSMVQARLHAALTTARDMGATAVDATVGTGKDTRFLAETVGEGGRVYGFDIQAGALEQARRRLGPLSGRVSLFQAGHETLWEALPEGLRGRVAVVVFNLGYLPGADGGCITRTETTLAALAASLKLLAPGGLLSVVAYTGHAGGREEAEAVKAWAEARRAEGCQVELTIPPSVSGPSPEWVLIRKPESGYTCPSESPLR